MSEPLHQDPHVMPAVETDAPLTDNASIAPDEALPVEDAAPAKARVPLVRILLFVLSLIGCAVLGGFLWMAQQDAVALESDLSRFNAQLTEEEAAVAECEAQLEDLKSRLSSLESTKDSLEQNLEVVSKGYLELADEVLIMSTLANFRCDDDAYYHTYLCEDLDFFGCSTFVCGTHETLSQFSDIEPCPKCHP